MKKAITLALALLMLCAGTALASDWQPGKPYEGVPEVDLTQSLGYVMFYPNSELAVNHACQRLYVYLPRTDVKAGSGSLHLYGGSGEIWSTVMDAEAVTLRPMREAEMEMFQWEDGVCFEIKLGHSLPLNEQCYVNLDVNCIVVEGSDLGNQAIKGPDEWPVLVGGDFGVGGVEYLHDGAITLAPTAGDAIRFDLTVGGDVALAAMYSPDASVSFAVGAYSESCEVVGEVTGDTPTWGVIFLDANGNELGRVAID